MTGVVVILCTAAPADAPALADALLAEGLVACVNLVGPVTSRYVWRGAVESASETLLVIKTAAARAAAVRERIVALHRYEVPEVVELPVAGGHAPYLDWVLAAVKGGG